jgi:undecaprenyl-diphosphatase
MAGPAGGLCSPAMSTLHAVVLGAVQGITEFLPISSSGHLVLVPNALNWAQPGLAFDVLLHAGSLIALLIYFSGELVDLVRGVVAGDRFQRRLLGLLAIGTVPAVIAGVLWADYFEDAFEDARASAIQLVITAVILVAAEQAFRYHERRSAERGARQRQLEDMRAPDAGVIGVAQAVAILPGISRSGSTIGSGLALGLRRDDSARFAFLLAIPALFGAALVEIPDLQGTTLTVGAGIAGFLTSLVVSYAAIWGLIRYLRTRTLYPFALYCVIAGVFFYVVT